MAANAHQASRILSETVADGVGAAAVGIAAGLELRGATGWVGAVMVRSWSAGWVRVQRLRFWVGRSWRDWGAGVARAGRLRCRAARRALDFNVGAGLAGGDDEDGGVCSMPRRMPSSLSVLTWRGACPGGRCEGSATWWRRRIFQ